MAAGAQGRTVDTGHAVVTPRTTAASLYVGMTRGRLRNHAHVVTDGHEHDELQLGHRSGLQAFASAVVRNPEGDTSATTVRRRWAAGANERAATRRHDIAREKASQWWTATNRTLPASVQAATAERTGAVIGVLCLLGGFTAAGAFAGLIVAFMLGLSGCNLYGQDGSAVWQNVVGEDETSVRSDVRGRQWAMILVFLPRVVVVTIPFLLISQAWWTVPYLLATIPATLGAATGAAVLTSAVGVSPGVDPRRRVGPNDANGNIALHVWVVILTSSVVLLPTLGMVIWAANSDSGIIVVVAALVGLVNGIAAAWLLGHVAIEYLRTRMVDVFSRIRYARTFADGTGDGLLDWLAKATLQGEQKMHAARQKARDDKLARAGHPATPR